ncbi:hypothetical protein SAMN05216573_107108 [Bradyrhizobium sp. Rc3b]|nr:hypothetical protein SAMN05216573_107108 [Bradyrhizobium sp. Rc3b]
MMRLVANLTAGCLTLAYAGYTEARSYPLHAFDGVWHLIFETRSGSCDASYNFDVNISNGNISHPNLVRFRGRVSRTGAVRASVTVQDKHAAGAGRLAPTSGTGSWSGYSGAARCSGVWKATKV